MRRHPDPADVLRAQLAAGEVVEQVLGATTSGVSNLRPLPAKPYDRDDEDDS